MSPGDEAVELLQALIRLDTVNPPGNETAAAELLRAYLEPFGVECELYARVPERANLVARVRGRSRQDHPNQHRPLLADRQLRSFQLGQTAPRVAKRRIVGGAG